MLSQENSQKLEENLIEIGNIFERLSASKTQSQSDLASLQMRQFQLAKELEQSQKDLRAKTKTLSEVENSLMIVLESLERAEQTVKKMQDKPNKINVAWLIGDRKSYVGARYISKNFGAGVYKKINGDDDPDYMMEVNYTIFRWN